MDPSLFNALKDLFDSEDDSSCPAGTTLVSKEIIYLLKDLVQKPTKSQVWEPIHEPVWRGDPSLN